MCCATHTHTHTHTHTQSTESGNNMYVFVYALSMLANTPLNAYLAALEFCLKKEKKKKKKKKKLTLLISSLYRNFIVKMLNLKPLLHYKTNKRRPTLETLKGQEQHCLGTAQKHFTLANFFSSLALQNTGLMFLTYKQEELSGTCVV